MYKNLRVKSDNDLISVSLKEMRNVGGALPFYMIVMVTGISFSSAQDDDAWDWNGSEER